MYGPGGMGYVGGGWRMGPRGEYAPSFPAVGLAVGVVIFLFAAASFDLFPFIFFFWCRRVARTWITSSASAR